MKGSGVSLLLVFTIEADLTTDIDSEHTNTRTHTHHRRSQHMLI